MQKGRGFGIFGSVQLVTSPSCRPYAEPANCNVAGGGADGNYEAHNQYKLGIWLQANMGIFSCTESGVNRLSVGVYHDNSAVDRRPLRIAKRGVVFRTEEILDNLALFAAKRSFALAFTSTVPD